MKRVSSSRSCRAYRMAASLPAALFVSSLLTAPIGLAADQHTHHGDVKGRHRRRRSFIAKAERSCTTA